MPDRSAKIIAASIARQGDCVSELAFATASQAQVLLGQTSRTIDNAGKAVQNL
jgi:hypothetical protein